MAGFTTHYIFGTDMVKKLKGKPVYKLIKRYENVYNLGLQGPDIFFYNFFIAHKCSKHRYGKLMHKYNINLFFSNAIDYITKKDNLEDVNEVLYVYLFGLLAHHALDAVVHPYVYSRSGYSPAADNSDESFGRHSLIELNIDKKYLINKKSMMPSQFYQHKTIILSKNIQAIIGEFLSDCIIRTYYSKNINNNRCIKTIKRNVKYSIKNYRFILFHLHDKLGYKRKAVQLFEKYILKSTVASNIILTDNLIDDIDSMNLNHKRWHHPWIKKRISYESFNELYDKAGDYYIKLIEGIMKGDVPMLYKKDIKEYILNAINNRSYHSGIKESTFIY